MKNVFSAVLMAASLFLVIPGCGGNEGAVTESASQSDLDNYRELLEANQAELEAAGAEPEAE